MESKRNCVIGEALPFKSHNINWDTIWGRPYPQFRFAGPLFGPYGGVGYQRLPKCFVLTLYFTSQRLSPLNLVKSVRHAILVRGRLSRNRFSMRVLGLQINSITKL